MGIRWYPVAVLFAPLLLAALFFILSIFSDAFIPGIISSSDKVSYLMMGLMTGLLAGIFEEIGWTGFAIPRLRLRFGVFATGLIAGILWAIWHLLPAFWLGFASGTIKDSISLASYMIDPFMFLIGFRILMVWVYDNTDSLFLAMVMHFSLTTGTRIFSPQGIVGIHLLCFDIAWLIIMCIIITIIARVNHGKLSWKRDSNQL